MTQQQPTRAHYLTEQQRVRLTEALDDQLDNLNMDIKDCDNPEDIKSLEADKRLIESILAVL